MTERVTVATGLLVVPSDLAISLTLHRGSAVRRWALVPTGGSWAFEYDAPERQIVGVVTTRGDAGAKYRACMVEIAQAYADGWTQPARHTLGSSVTIDETA